MEKATIYKIECQSTGRVYVGMSRNFGYRKHMHLAWLYSGRHLNKTLQRDFDQFGEAGFVFTAIRDVYAADALDEERAVMVDLHDAGVPLYNYESLSKRADFRLFLRGQRQEQMTNRRRRMAADHDISPFVWNPGEVAEAFGITLQGLRHRIARHDNPLPYIKIGKQTRYVVSEVKAWAEREGLTFSRSPSL